MNEGVEQGAADEAAAGEAHATKMASGRLHRDAAKGDFEAEPEGVEFFGACHVGGMLQGQGGKIRGPQSPGG